MSDLAAHIEPVARYYWGEPNAKLSNATELRFGTRGSKSVNLEKGCWYDHENNCGGGVIDLIKANEPTSLNGNLSELVERKFGISMSQQDVCGARGSYEVATYDYCDADGSLVYQVVRYANPKGFRQRQPDGNGGWINNLKGADPLLYNLPEILKRKTETIYLVEGEKDADALMQCGLLATTNSGGANKWHSSLTEALRGREVVILPDNDDAGRKHAERLLSELDGVASSVVAKQLVDVPEKGDVSDFLVKNDVKALLSLPPLTRKALFPFVTVDDLLDMPPIEWLIDGVLPSRGVGFLAGNSGSYKTFCAIHLSLHVLAGRNVCGKTCTPRGDVLFCAHEGYFGLGSRIEAACKYHKVSSKGLLIGRGISLTSDEHLECLLADKPDAGLIIIDTMAKATAGLNENEASDMSLAISRAEKLADGLGCFVLLIDHTGKDAGRGIRGSSSKRANVDTTLMVSRQNKAVSIKVDKQKDGPDDFSLDFEVVDHQWLNPKTGEIDTKPVLQDRVQPLTAKEQVLWALRDNGPMEVKELRDELCNQDPSRSGYKPITYNSLKQALHILKQEKSIIKQGVNYELCL